MNNQSNLEKMHDNIIMMCWMESEEHSVNSDYGRTIVYTDQKWMDYDRTYYVRFKDGELQQIDTEVNDYPTGQQIQRAGIYKKEKNDLSDLVDE